MVLQKSRELKRSFITALISFHVFPHGILSFSTTERTQWFSSCLIMWNFLNPQSILGVWYASTHQLTRGQSRRPETLRGPRPIWEYLGSDVNWRSGAVPLDITTASEDMNVWPVLVSFAVDKVTSVPNAILQPFHTGPAFSSLVSFVFISETSLSGGIAHSFSDYWSSLNMHSVADEGNNLKTCDSYQ